MEISNGTAADITLPEAVRIMETTKATGALHESNLKLSTKYFIPAHRTVSITLQNTDICAAKAEAQDCFDTNFKDEGAIIIFDEPSKYQIDIPVPVFSRLEFSASSNPSKCTHLAAVDHGKIWDLCVMPDADTGRGHGSAEPKWRSRAAVKTCKDLKVLCTRTSNTT